MERPRKLLIVEDDVRLAKNLADAFRDEGFDSAHVSSWESTSKALDAGDISLVILDRMLGKEDGFDIIRRIRQSDPILPIIMLTGRASETDRVSGLELGADDYVLKPFSLPELIARVRAHLRKQAHIPVQPPSKDIILEFDQVAIDTGSRKVMLKGKEIELTRQEFDLLVFFAENPNRALSRDQLLNSVWSDFAPYDVRAVDSSVKRLREKLESEPTKEGLIGTVRGVGYRLNANVNRRSPS